MKVLLSILISGAALLAQMPAPKTGARPSAARKAAPRSTVPDLYRVKFATTHGDFVIEVHKDWAPRGAARFYTLVRNHYYNSASFYRVVPNFIVQFGVAARPASTAAWEKANIKDDPVKQSNAAGTITFAMAGPNTRTAEVFINLRNNAQLDKDGFAPFGTVTEGMDVVQGLYSGYGDMAEMGGHGPSQDKAQSLGKPYLDKNFPKLDSIRTVTIVFPERAPAAVRRTVPAAKKQ